MLFFHFFFCLLNKKRVGYSPLSYIYKQNSPFIRTAKCGDGNRTRDLKVMSLVSYQTALLRSGVSKTGGQKRLNTGFYHVQTKRILLLQRMERVAGIEPASLAWKARGYSRRWLIIFNVSNSKPNMKLWFHSAPL